VDVDVNYEPNTGNPLCAFIYFRTADDLSTAVAGKNGSMLAGRPLHVAAVESRSAVRSTGPSCKGPRAEGWLFLCAMGQSLSSLLC
jgi:hypothetical protein